MLNRVLALRKIDKKGSVVFASAQSRRNKEGIATARSSVVAIATRGRGIAVSIELWPYSSFNGKEGG